MSYRIAFSERARKDLDRLLQSLAERSAEASERLANRFEDSIRRLKDFPLSCGLAYENREFPEEVRHLLFGLSKDRKYRALFTVRDDVVVILAIRAPGEKPIGSGDITPEAS